MRLEHILCLEDDNLCSDVFPEMLLEPSLPKEQTTDQFNSVNNASSHPVCVELPISRYPEVVGSAFLTTNITRVRLSD